MVIRRAALQMGSVALEPRLMVALELSDKKWLVGASDWGHRVSRYAVDAGDGAGLLGCIERARLRFGVGQETVVQCCYEAGRDGFWLHRFLLANGIENHVVDAASIEVNRRKRRVKTDAVDLEQLLSMLKRYCAGERGLWSVLRVPSEQQEDERRGHRERERLIKERGAHQVRIKSLLITHNIRLERVGGKNWVERVGELGLGPRLQAELEREGERLGLVCKQVLELEKQQRERLKQAAKEQAEAVKQQAGEGAGSLAKQQRLAKLVGIGLIGSWTLSSEMFGWRRFNNRRELAGCAGLGSSPYNSGDCQHDQGISKAGNRRIRSLMVELAWGWLRHQPDSALALWYRERFASAGGRMRRIGIVALARRLLIAFWHFVEHGVVPEGARLKTS